MIRRILSIGIGIYIYIFEIMFFRISDLGFVNSHTLPECGGPGVVQIQGDLTGKMILSQPWYGGMDWGDI